MTEGLRISAVLPCFEEAELLPELADELRAALDLHAAGSEIILVTSLAACDGTPEVARHLSRTRPGVRVVRQPASDPGYGRALALGIAAAAHPWLLLMDADGQLDPGDLARLVPLAAADVAVVGVRTARHDHLARRAAGLLYSAAVRRLPGCGGLRDPDCAFKLLPREPLARGGLRSRTGVVNVEIMQRLRIAGVSVVQVPVRHRPRAAGRSRFELPGHLPRPAEALAIARELWRLRREDA